jgi:hypothetical protein
MQSSFGKTLEPHSRVFGKNLRKFSSAMSSFLRFLSFREAECNARMSETAVFDLESFALTNEDLADRPRSSKGGHEQDSSLAKERKLWRL